MSNNQNVLKCFNVADMKIPSISNRISKVGSYNEFAQAEFLHLCHITSSSFLESIRENGLLPSSISGNTIVDNKPSDPMCIYLSVDLDNVYFNRAVKAYGGEGILVEVKVKKNKLEYDENSMPYNYDKKELTDDQLLYTSLNQLFGPCKHRGVIEPAEIIGIYNISGEHI